MSLQRSSAVQEHVRGHKHSESTSSMGSGRDNRRDTGGSAGGSRSARQTPAVESAVTRLLVAIKQLLESLTQWSQQALTDEQVSDIYVRLGNDFNAAVAAFESYRIDMSELMSVPDDLRDVLERCLSEDATPENLEVYLPKVRAIITNLLQGLRTKQSLYRARATDRSSRSRGDARTDSTSSRRGENVASSSDVEDPRFTRTNGSARSGRTTPGAETSRYPSARGKRSDPSGSSTRRAGNASDNERWVGGFAPPVVAADIPIPPVPQEATNTRPGLPRSPSSRRSNTSSSSRSATSGPEVVDGEAPHPRQRSSRQPSGLSNVSRPITETEVMEVVLPPLEPPIPVLTPPLPKEMAPPEMKRYSLSDRPTPVIEIGDTTPRPSSDAVDSSSPPPDTPNTPGVESSLAALKSSEALQRRASKRFSTYTFSKMTGAGGGPNLGVARKTLAAGTILTPGDLVALTEADEDDGGTPTKQQQDVNVVRRRSTDRRRKEESTAPAPSLPNLVDSRSITPTPPVPSLVNGDYSKDIATNPPTNGHPLTHVTEDTEPPPTPLTSANITVFLQVLRQVKKVTMEPPQSFGALRVLFVDKFAYSPGQGNFPAIYIRDPSSGVQYELEDVSEVKDKCLLSLNIEPLDQLKQHLDGQLLSLQQDLKDLKSSVYASRRMSLQGAAAQVMAMNATPHMASRPTERQFQTAARQITKVQAQQHHQPTAGPLVPQLTGASDFPSGSPRIVADLKAQFDEVQNIRRDLGVMRQMYLDFVSSTKESLGALKTQAGAVRQVANAKVGGARTAISTGKAKLDKRSQDILTEIEDLQDTVENLKEDVLKRHVTPQGFVLKRIKDKIAKTNMELESLQQHISVIRPAWKKTWEEELQNIVEEQQFLTHQEELIEDLNEDHKALTEVWGHVEKVISIRGATSSARVKTFRLLPPDEGHTGLGTVMLEIRGAQVDPEKRMKAIEAQQRARKLELESRGDEFEDELKGFVQGKKLKMTGGAEEVERLRQKKNEMAFKAMFSPSGSSLAAMNTGTSAANGDMNGFGGPMVLPGLATAPPQPDDATS